MNNQLDRASIKIQIMNELLKDFSFEIDFDVEWGDMDALQHAVSYTHLRAHET